jgi:benzil reductase ((S)-benzoin forming)
MKDVYVVTGASKGIGRALCLELSSNGFSVIGLARSSEQLESLGDELTKLDSNSIVLECDLANPLDIEKVSQSIKTNYQRISGLVHNAGMINPIKPMAFVESSDWANLIQVNLIGVQDLTQRLYSLLIGEEQVRITTISSGASKHPIGSWSAYCVSKAGLDMWTRCLAEEGEKDNISAISVAPGIVDTNMQVEIRSSKPEEFPLHPHFMDYHKFDQLEKPEKVANQLLALVTEHDYEQTGQRFDVRDL